jgi:hypothetical protein
MRINVGLVLNPSAAANEPLTRPSATLSPLCGARGSRHTHRECPSPRLAGRRCREAADEGRSQANLDTRPTWSDL